MKTSTPKLLLLLSLITLLSLPDALVAQSAAQPIKVGVRKRVRDQSGSYVYAPYEDQETRTVNTLPGFKETTRPKLSKFGGDLQTQETATGFFRTQKVGDRWWIIDPEGHHYLHVAMNSTAPGNSERNKTAFATKFKTAENWVTATNQKLHELGFVGTGSWSDHDAIRNAAIQKTSPLAYCINWNFMSSYGKVRGGTFQQPGHLGYPKDAIFVFDSAFVTFCDHHARQLLAYKDDSTLFGYFSDNEMPFPEKSLDNFLALPVTDEGHRAAIKWLREKGVDSSRIDAATRDQFRAFVGATYFSIVNSAIKKYDPNHLYLGSRLYSSEKSNETFMRAIAPFVDVLSCNYYGVWTPNAQTMRQWGDWTNKPFLVTEWYTKGEDSGMPNQSGAGWIVKTQKDRGLFYQNYTLALLQSSNCVGWHWFKYQDNDPLGKGADPSNTDANKGILDNNYDYYTDLITLMKQLNDNRFALIRYFHDHRADQQVR